MQAPSDSFKARPKVNMFYSKNFRQIYKIFMTCISFLPIKIYGFINFFLPRCKDRIATGQTTTTLMNNFQCLMINVHRLLPLKLYIDNQLFIGKQVCC